MIYIIRKLTDIEGTSEFRNIIHSNRLDLGAQLVEHWTSKSKVMGSMSTKGKANFSARTVWIYTQRNITITI